MNENYYIIPAVREWEAFLVVKDLEPGLPETFAECASMEMATIVCGALNALPVGNQS